MTKSEMKRLEELENGIKKADEAIFQLIEYQDKRIDEIRVNGRRARDCIRRCIENSQDELYVLRILKLCHTGR